jgi:hypothetical protein
MTTFRVAERICQPSMRCDCRSRYYALLFPAQLISTSEAHESERSQSVGTTCAGAAPTIECSRLLLSSFWAGTKEAATGRGRSRDARHVEQGATRVEAGGAP